MIDTATLDFVYLESDPRTQQPSACVFLKAAARQDYAGVQADRLLTAQCLSFIELDAEIRRLHAELDEVRSRAKKKFYKTHATTTGV